MAAIGDESDLENDWTFVDPGTIESVEARQGSVRYSKRTTSLSSDVAPCSADAGLRIAESSGSEAEFEVLPCAPAESIPDVSSSPHGEDKAGVPGGDRIESHGVDNADVPSGSDDCSETPHCLDDGIMIISNHFSPSLEEECDKQHDPVLSSSMLGWQELPRLTESTTSFLVGEQDISDDEAGIVTIPDEGEDEDVELIKPGKVMEGNEEFSGSESSEFSSFLFASDLFDVSYEEPEILDLNEGLDVTSQHQVDQAVGENEENGGCHSDDEDNSDGEGDEENDDGDEAQEEQGDIINVDAPTFIILLCLTTALGFSIGHGLNIYLNSDSTADPSRLERPGPDTASFLNELLSLKFPEDTKDPEQVRLWKEKEASIALMFDLKELHSKLQREHFSLIKSYDAMKKRLHVSKVMGWYWRWKFQHEKVADDGKLSRTRALETQLERLQALYSQERRLADLWRGEHDKLARNKLHGYWKSRHRRWLNVQSNNDESREAEDLKTSSSDADAEVCSDALTDFRRRWTQDARGKESAPDQNKIAVSDGQETRVFSWDHVAMKATREMIGSASTEGSPRNILAIYLRGNAVKDIIADPEKTSRNLKFPDYLQLVMENGSARELVSYPDENEVSSAGRNEERTTKKGGDNRDHDSEHSAPLYAEYYTNRKQRKCPVDSEGNAALDPQEQLDRGSVEDSERTNTPGRAGRTTGERKSETSTAEKQDDSPRARNIRQPCLEEPVAFVEEKLAMSGDEEAGGIPSINETTSYVLREVEVGGKAIRREKHLPRERKVRTDRLARRKLRQRERDLERNIRKAGRILQALYTERRRINRQKAQLRHEKHNLELAKSKFEDDRKRHQSNQGDVEMLIAQLQVEKKRLQKWHKKEGEAFRQSLSKEMRKLKEGRRKYERKKGAELKQITTKLAIERRKLKSDYKNLKALRKAARKEYRKWLKELRGVRKRDKQLREKTDRKPKKDTVKYEHRNRKHKDRDKRELKDAASRKRGKTKDSKDSENSCGTVKGKVSFADERDKVKRSVKKPHKKRSNNSTSENIPGKKAPREDRHIYRRQVENLQKWWLQVNEQKLDQEQIRKSNKPYSRRTPEEARTDPGHDQPTGTALEPEKNRAVTAFASVNLGASSAGKVRGSRGRGTNSDTTRPEKRVRSEESGRNESSRKPPGVIPNPTVAGREPPGPIRPGEWQGPRKPRMRQSRRQHSVESGCSHRSDHAARQTPCFARESEPDRNPKRPEPSEPDGPIPPEGLGPPPDFRRDSKREPAMPDERSWYVHHAEEESLRKSGSFPSATQSKQDSSDWMFERASDRAEQRHNWEPWYERRVKGRDEWRANWEPWYERRAKGRDEWRANWEPWYERRAKGRDEWRANWEPLYERRAKGRDEWRAKWEPWYERRAKGRDDWRTTNSWWPESVFYGKLANYLSDWREGMAWRGRHKRRGGWGA